MNYRHTLAHLTKKRAIVVIPTLDEAAHIGATLDALGKDRQADACEFWVVDGGSEDGTREIVAARAEAGANIRLVHNPGRTQANAVNLAAQRMRAGNVAPYLIRADAHAAYPEHWISTLIAAAEETGADSVVAPMETRGGDAFRNASADLFNGWLGNGGAAHRSGKLRGFVEHGHHALFRLEAFCAAGGYDARFRANEDAELDLRLIRDGGRIFLETRAAIGYVPRGSLAGVWRQFYRNGRYRLCTAIKHGRRPGARQLAPIALATGLAASVALAAFWRPQAALPAALYVFAVILASFRAATRKTPSRVALIAATAATAHLAFGLGGLVSLASYLASGRLPVDGPARAPAPLAPALKRSA